MTPPPLQCNCNIFIIKYKGDKSGNIVDVSSLCSSSYVQVVYLIDE